MTIVNVQPGSRKITLQLTNQTYVTATAGMRVERVWRMIIQPWQSITYTDGGRTYGKTAGREAIPVTLVSRTMVAKRTV